MNKPTIVGVQKRTLRGSQLRAESQGDEMALEGYAASFNCLSQDLGGFREMLKPGCFSRSLKEGADVKCTMNHDPNLLLGRVKNGSLKVSEDSYGLKFRCELDVASATARELHTAVRSGLIDECSFAFTLPDGGDEWDESVDENGKRFARRSVRNCDLIDVSAVTYPAYDKGTGVSARSADYVNQAVGQWRAEMRRKLDAAMTPQPPSIEELRAKAARLAASIK